jgi:hypothetical protein
MQNPELQILLFYGKDIAQNKVSVSNGIKLRTLQKPKIQLFFVTIDTKSDCI